MRDHRRHWESERNWRLGSIYVCRDDPRWVVSKKRRWAGWTFNFAHRGSYFLLIFVLAVAIGPSLYVVGTGHLDMLWYTVAGSAAVALSGVAACATIGRS